MQSTHHTKLYLASMEPTNSSATQPTRVMVVQSMQQTMLHLASTEVATLPATQQTLLILVVVQSMQKKILYLVSMVSTASRTIWQVMVVVEQS